MRLSPQDVNTEQNSAVIFPMPLDTVEPFLELLEKGAATPGAVDPALAGKIPLAA